MDRELTILRMKMCILVSTSMGALMGTANTSGAQELLM
jgi:hypothetical protein